MTQDDIDKVAANLQTSADPKVIAAVSREQGWHDAAFFLRNKGLTHAAVALEKTQDLRSLEGNKAAALYTKLRENP